ncbi:MAG TPA: glycosyltransferase family 87 protein [Caulobacterales bacterium]|nr:glycosyltransferase family 87 protein [Caulobacterales bacterium]
MSKLIAFLKQRWLWEAGAVCVAITIMAFYAWRLSTMQGMVVNRQPLFGDYIAFWSAGKLALAGHADQVHNTQALFAQHKVAIPHLTVVAPWNSPPTWLLVCAVFAVLPYPAAAIAFLIFSAVIYFIAARKILPDARALLFAATLPAAVYEIGSVQVGIIIAGMAGLAILWMDKRPIAAGALMGLLTFKPHLAVLWPVLLILSGRWKAFASAAGSAIVFALTAGLVFGFDSYLRFLDNLRYAYSLFTDTKVSVRTFASLYGDLRGLHTPHWLALALHSANAAAAFVLACWVFWKGDRTSQGVALCAATMMLSPYLFFYDSAILGLAAALLWPPRNKLEALAVVAGWAAGLTVALGAFAPIPVCPIAAWILLGAALQRTGFRQKESEAPHLAPALGT